MRNTSADDVARSRRERRVVVERATSALVKAEEAYRAAVVRRDQALIDGHGDRRTGGLSYEELAEVAGVSKGRVIQIVQGKSEMSKQRTA
jgi:hypothetical protein